MEKKGKVGMFVESIDTEYVENKKKVLEELMKMEGGLFDNLEDFRGIHIDFVVGSNLQLSFDFRAENLMSCDSIVILNNGISDKILIK